MCSVEQMSSPIVSPCSLPITVSSRQTRTSCAFVRNTSGPMKPATSLRCTHGRPGVPAFARALGHVAAERPREAVLARLVDHHVEALAVAVGGVGALTGLEVQAEASGALRRVRAHLLDVDVEHGVGVGDAGEALEPRARSIPGTSARPRPARRCAPARSAAAPSSRPKVAQEIAQRHFDGGHLIDVARHRVGAEHDVADGVRPAVEHLQDDVLGIVGRRVGLDARAHVAPGADVRSRAAG